MATITEKVVVKRKTAAERKLDWEKESVAAVRAAIEAAVIVDRSHEGLHKALVAMVLTARNGWKKGEPQWDLISEYVRSRKDWMIGSKDQGLTTASVIAWFKQIADLKIDKTGSVSAAEDLAFYNRAWAVKIRAITWYKLARDMQQFKLPDFSRAFTTFAQAVAQNQYLGEEVDFEKIGEKLALAVKQQTSEKRYKDWTMKAQAEAKKKGLDNVVLLREVV